jgi:hypothetical protein
MVEKYSLADFAASSFQSTLSESTAKMASAAG